MRISDWSSDVCSSDLRWQWTVRNRQTLRERLEGDEGEGVLDAGEGLNLLVHEVADVGAVPEVAPDQQVVLPRRGVDRSEERRVGKEGVRTSRSRWTPDH